jgi:hypothetical protein
MLCTKFDDFVQKLGVCSHWHCGIPGSLPTEYINWFATGPFSTIAVRISRQKPGFNCLYWKKGIFKNFKKIAQKKYWNFTSNKKYVHISWLSNNRCMYVYSIEIGLCSCYIRRPRRDYIHTSVVVVRCGRCGILFYACSRNICAQNGTERIHFFWVVRGTEPRIFLITK